MVHAAMAAVQPGEVLVLTMPEPRPVALVGDLLATQAKAPRRRGHAGRRLGARRRGAGRAGPARSGRAGCASRAPARTASARSAMPVTVGGATIRPGDILVLDADGVAVVEARARRGGPRGIARAPRARARQAREAAGGRGCHTTSTACGKGWSQPGERTSNPRSGPHRPRRAAHSVPGREPAVLRRCCSGWRSSISEGQSVYLRGWGDYQPYRLKLTESALPGLGHAAIRAWSPEALHRRVAAIEQTGSATGWNEGDHGHGPAYAFKRPRRSLLRGVLRAGSLYPARAPASPPEERSPAPRRPRRGGQAARSRQRARRRRAPPTARFAGRPARLPRLRAGGRRRRLRGRAPG